MVLIKNVVLKNLAPSVSSQIYCGWNLHNNSYYWFLLCQALCSALGFLSVFLITTQFIRCYYPHLLDKETKSLENKIQATKVLLKILEFKKGEVIVDSQDS